MKRILILLILILCFHISDAVGQSFVVASNPAPVTTQLNDGRYEFIQSPVNSSLHFLLDKFTGNVWRYKMSKDEFDELYDNLSFLKIEIIIDLIIWYEER